MPVITVIIGCTAVGIRSKTIEIEINKIVLAPSQVGEPRGYT